jgi:hypothetical protein
VFRDLLIARIVEPTSKADAGRVLVDLGANTVSYRTIQLHLDQMGPGNPPTGAAARKIEARVRSVLDEPGGYCRIRLSDVGG